MTGKPNPYPGPIPLQRNQSDLLFGRKEMIEDFVDRLRYHNIGQLTGVSGVGKTSLLQAGIVPALEAGFYTVGVNSDWRPVDAAPGNGFALNMIKKALGDPLEAPDGDYLDFLFRRDNIVVVFDQLEELFRDDPFGQLGQELLRGIIELVRTGCPVRFVLSLRSEYADSLSPLHDLVGSVYGLAVGPVPPSSLEEIVSVPAFGMGLTVEDGLIQRLVRLHMDSGGGTLLPLQALLWLLMEEHLNGSSKGRLGQGTLTSLFRRLGRQALPDDGESWWVSLALQAWFSANVLSHSALADAPLRERDEILDVVALIAPKLSSGSYKLQVDARSLGEAVLLELGVDRETADVLMRSVDRIQSTGSVVVSPSSLLTEAAESGELPEIEDRRAVIGAGRCRYLSSRDVAAEVAWNYSQALNVLTSSRVVRVAPGQQGRSIALVHDGFGQALRDWSQSRLRDPAPSVRSLVERVAVYLASENWHQVASDTSEALTTESSNTSSARINRVSWVGGYLTGCFRNVEFVECNLKSTLFKYCVLENVTFTNCDLDGAMVQRSTIRGVLHIREAPGSAEAHSRDKGEERLTRSLTIGQEVPPSSVSSDGDYPAGVELAKDASILLDGVTGYGLMLTDLKTQAGAGEGECIRFVDCRLKHVQITSSHRLGATSLENSVLHHMSMRGPGIPAAALLVDESSAIVLLSTGESAQIAGSGDVAFHYKGPDIVSLKTRD